jgi:hypothetical protein
MFQTPHGMLCSCHVVFKYQLYASHPHLHDGLALVHFVAGLHVGHDVPGGAAAGVAVLPQGGKGGQHLGGRQLQPALDALEHSIATCRHTRRQSRNSSGSRIAT